MVRLSGLHCMFSKKNFDAFIFDPGSRRYAEVPAAFMAALGAHKVRNQRVYIFDIHLKFVVTSLINSLFFKYEKMIKP